MLRMLLFVGGAVVLVLVAMAIIKLLGGATMYALLIVVVALVFGFFRLGSRSAGRSRGRGEPRGRQFRRQAALEGNRSPLRPGSVGLSRDIRSPCRQASP